MYIMFHCVDIELYLLDLIEPKTVFHLLSNSETNNLSNSYLIVGGINYLILYLSIVFCICQFC
jgi:hypothetical protein